MPFLVFFWCLSLLFEVKMVLLLPLGVRAFDHKVSMHDCQELLWETYSCFICQV